MFDTICWVFKSLIDLIPSLMHHTYEDNDKAVFVEVYFFYFKLNVLKKI
jgi:hypothetical protein